MVASAVASPRRSGVTPVPDARGQSTGQVCTGSLECMCTR